MVISASESKEQYYVAVCKQCALKVIQNRVALSFEVYCLEQPHCAARLPGRYSAPASALTGEASGYLDGEEPPGFLPDSSLFQHKACDSVG